MDRELQPVCAPEAACKCCGSVASLYGVVDFHKNCEVVHNRKVLDLSGVPVYYHRCPQCRFIFTTAFDHFTIEDFHRHIYNEQYTLVDPDYKEARPKVNATNLCAVFAGLKPRRTLDYGGGNGALAGLLRAGGFPAVDTYDPFVPAFSSKPSGRYDCVVSFEVLEHTTHPKSTLGEMIEFLEDPGLLVFSTLVQPADIDRQGLNWWYAAPRNGHVSLYSAQTLATLAKAFGYRVGSLNENAHVMFRTVPPFAQHFISLA
jgi:2-polyprenyl-6-hydroxyphenyl methylase/3-demethylubiquinone-9 3-methyltransferase